MTSTAKGQTKHPVRTFERKAGHLPTLKRAGLTAAATPAVAKGDADQPAEANVPGFLSHKEVLLRLVETLRAL